MNSHKQISTNIIFICFILASTATLGSLFFSEIMHFIPCSMCWYQRIFLYPLVLIFLVNLLYPDDKVFKYAISLIGVGFLISLYHNLLMWDIIPESIVPCVSGVPCSTVYINWFGFITIPFLSLITYSLLLILLILGKINEK